MPELIKPYTLLTGLYDNLMEYVDYEGWSEYILDIVYEYDHEVKSALELASGNCKLSKYLKGSFDEIVVTDNSMPLLKEFAGDHFPAVCCDMRFMPFKKKFDLIYCTFDSINYLLTEEDMLNTFSHVESLLAPEGIFTFDASLENNSLTNVKELNREGEYKGYKYRQISTYYPDKKLHTNEFIISKDDKEFIEKHVQKVFDFVDYFRILDDAGLRVIDCFETFTFDNANPESERAQFIVEKM